MNDGVAAGKGGADFVQGQIQGEVEGGDGGDDAERLADDQGHLAGAVGGGVHGHLFAGEAVGLFGGEEQGGGAAVDFEAGFAQGLAAFARDDDGELFFGVEQQLAGLAEDSAALGAGEVAHGGGGGGGGVNGGLRLRRTGFGDRGERGAVKGYVHGADAFAGGFRALNP